MVGMEAYGGGVRERERERKRRRVGKDNSFCSAGERPKGGKKKKKKKKEEEEERANLRTQTGCRFFFFMECLIHFRGVGLVGWLVRKGRGEKKRDQIEREMSSYV